MDSTHPVRPLDTGGVTRLGAAEWTVNLRVRRLTGRGRRKVGKALDAIARAERATVEGCGIAAARSSVHPRPEVRRPTQRRRFVAVGLIAVNAAAVVLMLTPAGGAVGGTGASGVGIATTLGLLLAGVQIALAAAVGRKLRAAEHVPTLALGRPLPLEEAALGLVCSLVGWIIYVWTGTRVADDQPGLEVLLGMALALQAWIAPWLLVADVAGTRLTWRRELDVLDRRTRDLSDAWEADRSIASLALVAARSALHATERVLDRTAELSRRPLRASWSHALGQLRAAISDAEGAYSALLAGPGGDRPSEPPEGPLGRGDVDLVG